MLPNEIIILITEFCNIATYYQLCELNKFLNNNMKNNWKISKLIKSKNIKNKFKNEYR